MPVASASQLRSCTLWQVGEGCEEEEEEEEEEEKEKEEG
jgi:hypothetical protein